MFTHPKSHTLHKPSPNPITHIPVIIPSGSQMGLKRNTLKITETPDLMRITESFMEIFPLWQYVVFCGILSKMFAKCLPYDECG